MRRESGIVVPHKWRKTKSASPSLFYPPCLRLLLLVATTGCKIEFAIF